MDFIPKVREDSSNLEMECGDENTKEEREEECVVSDDITEQCNRN